MNAPGTWPAYLWSAGIVVLCAFLAKLASPYFGMSNDVMVFLLGVVVVATFLGRGPSILASILSVAAFDFFFVPPFYTFAVADTQYLFTFAVMLFVALVISTLMARLRLQTEAARQREQRTATLYSMSRDLGSAQGSGQILEVAARHIREAAGSPVSLLLPDPSGNLHRREGDVVLGDREYGLARWAFDHGEPVGCGSAVLPGFESLFLPLSSGRGVLGVLGLHAKGPLPRSEDEIVKALAAQTAMALEQVRLAEEARAASVTLQTERMRSTLLSSISHDLRTPLATITGAASSLLEGWDLPPETRRELAQAVHEEADRLSRHVSNLLDMTRLEAGAVVVRKEWIPLEEVMGSALSRVGAQLQQHPLEVKLPEGLSLVPLDSHLIEQVVVNLVENAVRYTPNGTPISVTAHVAATEAIVEVRDRGPGLPAGIEDRLFEKFFRGEAQDRGGAGLGLAICKGMVEAHGGRIWAESDQGAVFRFSLPIEGQPPAIAQEEAS